MKITKTQLKNIILEELKNMSEADLHTDRMAGVKRPWEGAHEGVRQEVPGEPPAIGLGKARISKQALVQNLLDRPQIKDAMATIQGALEATAPDQRAMAIAALTSGLSGEEGLQTRDVAKTASAMRTVAKAGEDQRKAAAVPTAGAGEDQRKAAAVPTAGEDQRKAAAVPTAGAKARERQRNRRPHGQKMQFEEQKNKSKNTKNTKKGKKGKKKS